MRIDRRENEKRGSQRCRVRRHLIHTCAHTQTDTQSPASTASLGQAASSTQLPYPLHHIAFRQTFSRDYASCLLPHCRENGTQGLGPTSDHHPDAGFNAISHKLQLCPMQSGRHLSDGECMSGTVTTDHIYTAGLQGLPIQEPLALRSHREVHREGDLTSLHCLHRLQRCLHSQPGDCRVGRIKIIVGDKSTGPASPSSALPPHRWSS